MKNIKKYSDFIHLNKYDILDIVSNMSIQEKKDFKNFLNNEHKSFASIKAYIGRKYYSEIFKPQYINFYEKLNELLEGDY